MAGNRLKPKTIKTVILVIFTAAFFNLGIFLASAAVSYKWGTEANGVVISNATDNQHGQKIIMASDGDFIIAWDDYRSGTNSDIYAQNIDLAGTVQWTANGVVISSASGNQPVSGEFDIVSDENRGAIIAWHDNRNSIDRIYIQRIASSGTVQWAANGFLIQTSPDGSHPALLSDGAGGAYLAYADSTSGTNDIYLTRVESTGSLDADFNPPIAIESTTNDETEPKLISAGTNDLIISYTQTVSGKAQIKTEKIAINSYSTYSPGDTVWSTVTSDGTDNLLLRGIISDGNSGVIMDYIKKFGGSGDQNIYAQRLNSSGAAQWGTGTVICNHAAAQDNPLITSDNSGGAIITWEDARVLGDIYAQRVGDDGVVQWTANGVAVSDTTDGVSQYSPAITSNGGHGAIIAFNESVSDYKDILIQYLDEDGVNVWTAGGIYVESDHTSNYDDTNPQIAGDDYGSAAIAWARDPNLANDIRAQYIRDTDPLISGPCVKIDKYNEFCTIQEISDYMLTFLAIPDSFNLGLITTGSTLHACNNTSTLTTPADICSDSSTPSPPGSDDLLQIRDERNSGGFIVQVTTQGTFSNGTETIPLSNLYLVTSIDETDPNKTGGIVYSSSFTGPKTVDPPIYINETTVDISDPDTYTNTPFWDYQPTPYGSLLVTQFGGYPLDLMIGTLSSSSGRIGDMSTYMDFDLKIDSAQADGDYSLILTYDLMDSTTP